MTSLGTLRSGGGRSIPKPLLFASALTCACPVVSQPVDASQGDSLAAINEFAAGVDSLARGEELRCTTTEESGLSEGVPPRLESCFRGTTLARIRILVGHETWTSVFTYYFREGAVVKYLETGDIPGAERRKAVFYGRDGHVVWKNTDSPRVDPRILQASVIQSDSLRRSFGPW